MFDIAWQELLVVGIVALIVVGPKELPGLLRTVGKYVGAVRRQANEFRAQFDEAMRESELEQLRKDVTKIKDDAVSTFRSVEQSVDGEIGSVRRELDDTARGIDTASRPSDAHDANGLPLDGAPAPSASPAPQAGAGAAAIAAAAAAAPPSPRTSAKQEA
jgi:sec-independent protein translocase protein TatB